MLEFIILFIWKLNLFLDAFKVPKLTSEKNLFNKYSQSKTTYNKNGITEYIHETKFGKYQFLGIDLAPNPGLGRPFNFFGVPREVIF